MHGSDKFDELEYLMNWNPGLENNEELGVFVKACGQQVLTWAKMKMNLKNKET